MYKKIGIIAGAVILALAVAWWVSANSIDRSLIETTILIKRVVYGETTTSDASLTIAFSRNSKKYDYANAAVDFNNDGQYAAYEVDGKTQEEWVVKNTPTKVFTAEGNNFSFKISDPKIAERQNLAVAVSLNKNSLDNWDGKEVRGSAFRNSSVASIETNDIKPRFKPNAEAIGKWGVFQIEEALAAGEELPKIPPPRAGEAGQDANQQANNNLPKEFDVMNADVPDILQGENECGPTSVANSLLWLAKKNNFTDKMPKTDAELINELKGDFKWGLEKGVLDSDFIPGKQAFAERHKIPIETHRVNAKDYDPNIVAKIAQELQKGQDVEIGIEFWFKQADGNWKLVGGHWVTAVGAMTTPNTQMIFIHDPLSPGPALLDVYKVDGTRIVDYSFQGNAVAYIQYAVAESPGAPPVQPPSDSSTPVTTASTATSKVPTAIDATTSQTSDATSSPSSSPVVETPAFRGQYETGTQGNYFYINLMVTPTTLAGQTFTGLEIDLNDQNPTLPEALNCLVNVNYEGGPGDWQSSISGSVHKWSGGTQMRQDAKSIMTLYFGSSFSPPSTVNMKVLNQAGNPTNISLSP